MATENNSNKGKNKVTEEENNKGNNAIPPLPPPSEKEKKEVDIKISLQTYCSGLPNSGIDQFAYERIKAKMIDFELKVDEDRTRQEWEDIYIRVCNS